MKAVITIAAVLSLSAGAALADCAGHMKTTASADVDTTIQTASVSSAVTERQSTADQTLILKSTETPASTAVTE
ncbi:hypothetical protein HGO38_10420 [Rhizobium sp. CG5]|uniref:hypothetical protein n=1 Tax=Rhizobium sp. CG5 TaxID=2726076 RepID=UPI00203331E7|nr:hypothetical protein [Rhizobium sp. CG5]MCM2473885.1 hypothetical protein [Rhizobium sp. CG5]